MPLNQFEHIIDPTILERGFSYYKKGYVTRFEEISNGEYEAIVLGTEAYTTHPKVENNIITEHQCDCPYDMGPVCKHIVAVILYLQQDKLEELNLRTSAKSGEGNKKKTKSVSQQIKELLKTIPHRKLITFIEENSKKDKQFRNYFLTYFSHLSENQSIENLQP
jgi:uncharacterized Zn finger protein